MTTVGYLAYMDDKSIIESNLDDIIDYIVQSGTETYNDRTSRGFGNRWSPYNEEERKQVIKLFNSGSWDR